MKKIIMTIAAVAIILGTSVGLSYTKDTDSSKIPVSGHNVTNTAYIPVGGASVDYVAYDYNDSGTVTTYSIPVGGA
jgi:uncharacterized protein YxeA